MNTRIILSKSTHCGESNGTAMLAPHIHRMLVQCWSSAGWKNMCSHLWERGPHEPALCRPAPQDWQKIRPAGARESANLRGVGYPRRFLLPTPTLGQPSPPVYISGCPLTFFVVLTKRSRIEKAVAVVGNNAMTAAVCIPIPDDVASDVYPFVRIFVSGADHEKPWVDFLHLHTHIPSQKTRYIDSMLVQCWDSVEDGGPTFNQHRINVSCLLG